VFGNFFRTAGVRVFGKVVKDGGVEDLVDGVEVGVGW
jgi:hypothetical protein